MSAAQVQRDREAEEIAKHRERLVWLEEQESKWSCGAPIDCHTRYALIRQSRAAITTAEDAA